MEHDSRIQSQRARRDSLMQRNMLLSMRLNHNNAGHIPSKAKATLRTKAPMGKTWRATNSPQRLMSMKNSSQGSGWNYQRSTDKNSHDTENARVLSPHRAQHPQIRASPKRGIRPSLSPIKAKSMSLDDFDIGKKLGKGKFGRVYCVRHKKTGFICALKAMEKSEIVHYNVQKQIRREVEIQSSLNHPNLTKLYGFFHDEKRVYLVMEYLINGELYKRLKSHGPLNDILASFYVYQMADALDFMHQRNIIHRDIKPENILIGFNNVIKLTDFGWSVNNPHNVKRKTLCGTIDYLSPELICSREYDDKVDIWALGVLTYELITNSPPFEEDSDALTHKRIVKGDLRFPESVSSDARDLILKLLKHKPQDRILLKDVKKHPWILKNRPFW
ncbi:hypothetical protein HG535_0B00910 [Zygotorulaspora mrakii]|uniref:Aurora kinase n=1 Tax=Zygotorulaspora mrakii TaxID=42260 RepID=A0A7H9AXR4_ZYGMR|nr:uncharacterized protein HG535_0B00910 [Zygotorulaspora mrakii]QLG71053.1 hypothetical protein HG535_0B00910 [Zygotorulaspora mrakii]